MRVVMPQAIVYPEAVAALRKAWAEPEIIPVHGPYGYWGLLDDLWHDGESFIIVEHDIIVEQLTLAELATCDSPYCAFPYLQLPGDPVTGLGCTKFTAIVTAAVDPFTPSRDVIWQNVDYEIISRVREEFAECIHEPWLRHLNPKAGPQ